MDALEMLARGWNPARIYNVLLAAGSSDNNQETQRLSFGEIGACSLEKIFSPVW